MHKIRENVKYVTASETHEVLLKKCAVAASLKVKAGLILDVQTRWNSTYYMLERDIKYRKAFVKLETFEQSEKIYIVFGAFC